MNASSCLPTAVLVAGTGRHLDHFAQLGARGELPLDLRLCISHKAGVRALDHAERHGIPSIVVDPDRRVTPGELSEQVFAAVEQHGVQLVLMAGFLRLLPIPAAWEGRVLNIHPSLLPAFGGKGYYGDRVQAAVLQRGCKVAGCTVHYVNNEYDSGPILVQRVCPVLPGDTVESLGARVFEQELLAYPEAVRLHLEASQA